MKEIWKSIAGYEGIYEVNNFGKVKRLPQIYHNRKFKEKALNICYNPGTGYEYVSLRKNKHNKNYSVHRLVAQAFIPNPNNYSDVNHKDGNKRNNNVNNLEWCTRSYNLAHAIKIGLVKNQCKICRQVTVKYNEKIIIFDTMKDCAAYFGFKNSWLRNQIRKHGLTFVYNNYEITVSERGNA